MSVASLVLSAYKMKLSHWQQCDTFSCWVVTDQLDRGRTFTPIQTEFDSPKNWVHYVKETGPVESWKIKDEDFSMWLLDKFA